MLASPVVCSAGQIHLKDGGDIGRGTALTSEDDAAGRVARACFRIEGAVRLLGRPTPPALRCTPEQRECFYETVRRRIGAAVRCTDEPRAQRLAEREAIFEVLQEHGLIRRTRGGATSARRKAEINS